ncbi:hypothetical protein I3271_09215 [Photobacterium leiognathi]|uniref:hypothetical protein n=1 Tax=Photobacterium leiognathi TaxID=553611 RepID=UPI001EDD12CF|nr:hypothetical protein [Photobacterium leiognathi]MCG3884868.1 hypothetical protein [Photobacterium leiognathi]
MNLFNEPWIPIEGGLQTFWGILSDTDTDHQLLVNSQEFEMQFIHLLCCMGSIALQPKSGDQIRKLIKSVDIKQAQANTKPFADLFDTDNFMQDLVCKE